MRLTFKPREVSVALSSEKEENGEKEGKKKKTRARSERRECLYVIPVERANHYLPLRLIVLSFLPYPPLHVIPVYI